MSDEIAHSLMPARRGSATLPAPDPNPLEIA